MAGLPLNKAMVMVGPPLLASASRFGSELFMLPWAVKLQVASELRLNPLSVRVPEAEALPPGELLDTMVFFKPTVAPVTAMPPPLATPVPDWSALVPASAELFANVELTKLAVPPDR